MVPLIDTEPSLGLFKRRQRTAIMEKEQHKWAKDWMLAHGFQCLTYVDKLVLFQTIDR